MNRFALVLTVLASGLAACAGAGPAARPTDFGNAQVFEGDDLLQARGNLVRGLAARLANSEVVELDGCLSLQIRGRKTIRRPEPPGVYIEGQRATGSCALEMLNVEDISRVEVYPGGVTQRPGYFSQMGGLILVFLKDGR